MSDIAVRFYELGHRYSLSRWVFQDYRAEVARGSTFALLGPNGCGKTTLLKVLLGALRPAAGSIEVHGRTAFVPQLFQVTFDYSVLDMVVMGRARRVGLFSQPSMKDEKACLIALDRFGIADLAHRPFHELSGGQRQLVIFARALVSEADILILDEPTSALDLRNQGVILDWIHRLSREEGLTVVFTTHHPHHARAVADMTMLMLGERRYLFGHTAEVMTEKHLHELYGVTLKRLQFEHDGRMVETFVPVHALGSTGVAVETAGTLLK
ncbi:MAG: ABC transporter ATP-binding protein [Syntrophobacteraceae bacterium]|nr:ABC transporter ATP-binding protein [Syntrophobacteraceae bacterium]